MRPLATFCSVAMKTVTVANNVFSISDISGVSQKLYLILRLNFVALHFLTLSDLRGREREGSSRPTKGFSSITYDRDKISKRNFD